MFFILSAGPNIQESSQWLTFVPKRQDKKDKVDSNYAAININDVVKLSVL